METKDKDFVELTLLRKLALDKDCSPEALAWLTQAVDIKGGVFNDLHKCVPINHGMCTKCIELLCEHIKKLYGDISKIIVSHEAIHDQKFTGKGCIILVAPKLLDIIVDGPTLFAITSAAINVHIESASVVSHANSVILCVYFLVL